jgi:hypothetical protein
MQGMGERFRNRLPLPARDCPLECLGKAWGVLTEAQEQRGGLPFGFIRFNHDGRQLLELVAFPHGHIQEHSGLPEVELGLFELPALPSLARGALVLGWTRSATACALASLSSGPTCCTRARLVLR